MKTRSALTGIWNWLKRIDQNDGQEPSKNSDTQVKKREFVLKPLAVTDVLRHTRSFEGNDGKIWYLEKLLNHHTGKRLLSEESKKTVKYAVADLILGYNNKRPTEEAIAIYSEFGDTDKVAEVIGERGYILVKREYGNNPEFFQERTGYLKQLIQKHSGLSAKLEARVLNAPFPEALRYSWHHLLTMLGRVETLAHSISDQPQEQDAHEIRLRYEALKRAAPHIIDLGNEILYDEFLGYLDRVKGEATWRNKDVLKGIEELERDCLISCTLRSTQYDSERSFIDITEQGLAKIARLSYDKFSEKSAEELPRYSKEISCLIDSLKHQMMRRQQRLNHKNEHDLSYNEKREGFYYQIDPSVKSQFNLHLANLAELSGDLRQAAEIASESGYHNEKAHELYYRLGDYRNASYCVPMKPNEPHKNYLQRKIDFCQRVGMYGEVANLYEIMGDFSAAQKVRKEHKIFSKRTD